MDRRKGIMGCMVASITEGTGQTRMTQSKVVDEWIHLIREVVLMGSILVLDQRDIMVITTIILIG